MISRLAREPLSEAFNSPRVGEAADELGAQFESLARRLRSAAGESPNEACFIGITSCARGEGVSMFAANLAIHATHAVGGSVLVLEANLERPAIASQLAVPQAPGLAEALSNPDKWNGCLHRSHVPNMWVMPAGKPTRRRTTLAHLSGVERLLEPLRGRFSFVVVDLPPATESAFGLGLAEFLDGVVLVLQAERMRVQVVERAKQLFAQAGVNVLGAVLNKRRMHIPGWLYRRL